LLRWFPLKCQNCLYQLLLYNPRDGQVYGAIYNPPSIGAWGDPARVVLPSSPTSLEYSQYHTDIFATLPDQDRLAIINYDTMTLRTTVPVGDSPNDIVYVKGADRLYVSNFLSGDISVVDAASYASSIRVDVGDRPTKLVFNDFNDYVYVINSGSNSVTILDNKLPPNVIATVDVGENPFDIGVNPHNNDVYVVNLESDTVSVISSTSNTVTYCLVICLKSLLAVA
jgi:YVTN family beta-propeller protein